ncbi:MAG: hypothetical protein R6W76_08050 [Caldilinea sp.]
MEKRTDTARCQGATALSAFFSIRCSLLAPAPPPLQPTLAQATDILLLDELLRNGHHGASSRSRSINTSGTTATLGWD